MMFIPCASLLLYGIACCLPVLELRHSNGTTDVMLGLRALAIGWSGFFANVHGWFANPLWLTGVVLAFGRKPLPATLAGLAALAVAATTFLALGRELPADEGNVTKMTIVRVLPGAYVWMSSMLLLAVTLALRGQR